MNEKLRWVPATSAPANTNSPTQSARPTSRRVSTSCAGPELESVNRKNPLAKRTEQVAKKEIVVERGEEGEAGGKQQFQIISNRRFHPVFRPALTLWGPSPVSTARRQLSGFVRIGEGGCGSQGGSPSGCLPVGLWSLPSKVWEFRFRKFQRASSKLISQSANFPCVSR
jgi:hypothetical protein